MAIYKKEEGLEIISAYGEESPERLCEILKLILQENYVSRGDSKDPTKYYIENNNMECFVYTISDPNENNTTPDFYLKTNKSYNLFIEDTGCLLKASGNNMQFQRATKFIPSLNNNDKKFYIMSDPNKNEFKLNNALAFRLWKTSGIYIIFENTDTMKEYLELKPYETFQEYMEDYKSLKNKLVMSIEDNTIKLELNVFKSSYNLIKNNKLNNDPGIGNLALTLMVLNELYKKSKKKPEIILTNVVNTQEQLEGSVKGNKVLRMLKHFNVYFKITLEFDKDIQININDYADYKDINPFKEIGSSSEKIMGIFHYQNSHLFNISKKDFIFQNHARTENTKVCYNGIQLDFPKISGKPDLIIKKEIEIEIIETEKYDNLRNGQKQIDSWSVNQKLYKFYTEKVNIDIPMSIYLELYDYSNNFNGDFSLGQFKNVKYILHL